MPHQRRTQSQSEGSILILNNNESGGWNEMHHEKGQYA